MSVPLTYPSWSWLLSRLFEAGKALGPWSDTEIETLAVKIFTAMESPHREYHTLKHLTQFSPSDPTEILAVLFHDVVYLDVDGQWPESFASLLDQPTAVPFYQELAHLFGFSQTRPLAISQPTQGSPPPGRNEFFSAIAFAGTLGVQVGRTVTLEVAACIEATIPFRGQSALETLYQRLLDLGLDADAAVARAVHLANQDVESFQFDDPGNFLAGTWDLLPELNPVLRLSPLFSIKNYRQALERMEKFFFGLKADQLMLSWRGLPTTEELAAGRQRIENNLTTAGAYLDAKLLAAGLLEALAVVSGGDVPISLFMGAPGAEPSDRLEAKLPPLPPATEIDQLTFLLEWGRSKSTGFDLTNSPLAAWLWRQMSPGARQTQRRKADDFFNEQISADEFLHHWPENLSRQVAQAVAALVPTRRTRLAPWL